jgi:hypothetical protein
MRPADNQTVEEIEDMLVEHSFEHVAGVLGVSRQTLHRLLDGDKVSMRTLRKVYAWQRRTSSMDRVDGSIASPATIVRVG